MKHPELDEQDTARLSTRSDVPPEMLRALQALKAEGPSRRTLDLVATRLGGLLDAPPPAAHPAEWLWRGLGARAVALRIGVAALTAGTAAVWLAPSVSRQSGAPAASGSEAAPAISASAPVLSPPPSGAPAPAVALPAAIPAEGPAIAAAAISRSGEGKAGAVPAERAAARGRSRRSRAASVSARTSSADAPAPVVDRQLAAPSTSAERAETQAPAPPAHAEVVGPTPDAGAPREAAEAPEVRLPSEVELMLEARRLAVRDPRAAQRLLEQHAARFPKGVLAPEREVLAIEVLRALGQTAAAEQRLQAFRARYPNSMHLRRLSSPATPAR